MHLSKTVTLISTSNQFDVLSVDNATAQARISLYGGHILSFMPKSDQRERLWLSEKAVLNGSKAIRGGIPICWPWFGDNTFSKATNGTLPAHGYVRNQTWHVISCEEIADTTKICLKPESAMGSGLTGTADLLLSITIGHTLNVELTTTNIGTKAFTFGGALHSYFAVTDIMQTQLTGLSGEYLDRPTNMSSKQTPVTYLFEQETDRVHLNPVENTQIVTPEFTFNVQSFGHDSLVVWNPWIDKSVALGDMSVDGYKTMVCVETAVTQGITLTPNQQHKLLQVIA
ncbi:D-hexose-6-phosphate mutarotase [Alteromonadaceae bacterium BrNp21-10]|nr:D-hexose-6-phosphate mutarotase [Alteromonadaceae bacterium BrNp21-10]